MPRRTTAGRRVATGLGLAVLAALSFGLASGSSTPAIPPITTPVPPCQFPGGYDGYGGYGGNRGDGGYGGYGGYIGFPPCVTPTPTSSPQATPTATATATATPPVIVRVTPTPTPGTTRDVSPPAVRLTLPARLRLRALLKSGLKLKLSCGEPCVVRIDALVDRKTAKRFGIDRRAKRDVTVASLRRSLPSGSGTVTLRLSAKAGKRLAHARSLKLKLALAATDAAGNVGRSTKTLSIRS